MPRLVQHLCLALAVALALYGGSAVASPSSSGSLAPGTSQASPAARSDADALTRLARRLATPTSDNSSSSAAQRSESANEQKPLGPAPSAVTGSSQPSFAKGLSWGGSAPANDGTPGIMTVLTSLGLVIALIFMLRWTWTKMGGKVTARNSPVIEILSRTSVAPKNHIVLVRIGGRLLVVGDSPSGLRSLAQIEDPDEIAGVLEAVTASKSNSVTSGFSQLLSRSEEQFDPHTAQRRLLQEGADHAEFRLDRARESVAGLLSRIKTLSGTSGPGGGA